MCISTIVCYFLCDSETERPESILRERIGPGKKSVTSIPTSFDKNVLIHIGIIFRQKQSIFFKIQNFYCPFGYLFTWFQFDHSIFWTGMLISKIHIFWEGHKRLKKSSTYYLVGTTVYIVYNERITNTRGKKYGRKYIKSSLIILFLTTVIWINKKNM